MNVRDINEVLVVAITLHVSYRIKYFSSNETLCLTSDAILDFPSNQVSSLIEHLLECGNLRGTSFGVFVSIEHISVGTGTRPSFSSTMEWFWFQERLTKALKIIIRNTLPGFSFFKRVSITTNFEFISFFPLGEDIEIHECIECGNFILVVKSLFVPEVDSSRTRTLFPIVRTLVRLVGWVATCNTQWRRLLRSVIVPMFSRRSKSSFSFVTHGHSKEPVSSQISLSLDAGHEIFAPDISSLFGSNSSVMLISSHISKV